MLWSVSRVKFTGQADIKKEHPNVVKMKILGATLISVTRGTATLKDAVDRAFDQSKRSEKLYLCHWFSRRPTSIPKDGT